MREELKQVLDKAADCLDDSNYLYKGGRYEGAVNRAYYAVFTAVQGLLLDKDVFVKTHAGAKSKFHELYLKTNLLPAHLGDIFQNAFDLRQEADYEFATEVTEESARRAIEDASIFLDAVIAFINAK